MSGFVTNRQASEQLIDDTNARLPVGSLLLVSPLAIIEIAQAGDSLWQITAVGDHRPWPRWLTENRPWAEFSTLTSNYKSRPGHGPLTPLRR